MLLAAALAAGASVAAEPPATAKQEIRYLLAHLEASGCQFYRNGSWHSAKDASGHLQKKYQYLLDRGMISSAESFIEQGASSSSMSGKPYQVRCGNDAKPETSAVWLTAELSRIRRRGK